MYVAEQFTEQSPELPSPPEKLQDNLRHCPGFNDSEVLIRAVEKPCYKLEFCPYGALGEKSPRQEEPTSPLACKLLPHDCPVFYHFSPMGEY